MFHSHQLTAHHQDFLNQNRTDPITGEKIEEGHTVVICAACKSAFFIESWEYLGHSHCDQTDTLQELPISQNLYFKTNDKYTKEGLTFGFSTKPMLVEMTGSGCVLYVIGGAFALLGTMILINFFGELVGFIVGFATVFYCLISGLNNIEPLETKNKSIKEVENMETKFDLQINYKDKGIALNNIKNDKLKSFFPFETIEEFKYHIIYHPNREIDALYCQLQVRIKTKVREKNYFATIHRDTIPEWSEFISKLPTDLRIINTPFPPVQ